MSKISLGYNAVPSSAEQAILRVFRSGQYSPGAVVREFETAWARLHGARYAVFVNSGTDALRMSLLALKEKYGWSDGDWVCVPALTFVATVNVILQSGLRPFFVDVGERDYLIDAWDLGRRNGKRESPILRGVVPVHLFGRACGGEIFRLATRMGMAVLEDSCETIGNRLMGSVSCYSTYMAHHVTTGVGGMAVTNDGELNMLMRSYANHGRDVSYLPGYKPSADIAKRFRFERVGYSSRGTEFEAALGLSQLAGLKKNLRDREAVAGELHRVLKKFDVVTEYPVAGHTWMVFPVVLREGSKREVCRVLEREGIETRDMMPIVGQPCYEGLFRDGARDFPVAENINKNGFYIPCHPGIGAGDIRQIERAFDKALGKRYMRHSDGNGSGTVRASRQRPVAACAGGADGCGGAAEVR